MTDAPRAILRAYRPREDAPLIYSSWRNSSWYSEPRDEKQAGEFFSAKSKEIRKLLNSPDLLGRVACMSDNIDQIIGYSFIRAKHLYWIYVKEDYRKQGIGRLLSSGAVTFSEPITKIAKVIAQDHDLAIKDPYE